MNTVVNGEAVAVALEPERDGGYRECKLTDFQDKPLHLVMGVLKGQEGTKYRVDVLNNWYGIKGTAVVGVGALGIPVSANVTLSTGRTVLAFGAVSWDTDFEAPEIEAYTDHGTKTVSRNSVERIRSWL